MTVISREQAWREVDKIFPTDYEKDELASQNAGYDIYRHPILNPYSRICDLYSRLEVLTGEWGNQVTNIWILGPSASLTFKVTVTHRVTDESLEVMTTEINGVDRVERTWEKIGGEMIRLSSNSHIWSTWVARNILNINMIPEGGRR